MGDALLKYLMPYLIIAVFARADDIRLALFHEFSRWCFFARADDIRLALFLEFSRW
jgi:hypothetical protein